VYGSYSLYDQSGGIEQSVFDQRSGRSVSRSAQLLETILHYSRISVSGQLLDVGCGNGSFLEAFGALRPDWVLVGNELDSRYQRIVEALPGVKKMYSAHPDAIPGEFDIVSLIHVLEHVRNPMNLLTIIHRKLKERGMLLIQVPSYEQNPFDLLIADHCTHFSSRTLMSLITRAGFKVEVVNGDWIPKEMTVLAGKGDRITSERTPNRTEERGAIRSGVAWLQRVLEAASEISRREQSFGILGTSIAGSWLCSSIGEPVSFFVDEDRSRVGRLYMRRPVYDLESVPVGAAVFIAQPLAIAERIRTRLEQGRYMFSLSIPPPLV
jgi:2-polyprenyl-3-methyl-5-hydroxy-6-metoxy-1,4-benzoquinol methylase